MPTLPCNKSGCTNHATNGIGFELRESKDGPRAVTAPFLYVCNEHSDVEWADVCNDQGWANICTTFESKGLKAPLKEHSNIYIKPLK